MTHPDPNAPPPAAPPPASGHPGQQAQPAPPPGPAGAPQAWPQAAPQGQPAAPYGQQNPGYGQQPSPHGQYPGGYGQPAQGYGQPGWTPPPAPRTPLHKKLDDAATLWFVVACIGWLIGLFFITGPLAWWQGARIQAEYRANGLEPTGIAKAALIIGVVSSIMGALALLLVFGMIAFLLVAAAAGA